MGLDRALGQRFSLQTYQLRFAISKASNKDITGVLG